MAQALEISTGPFSVMFGSSNERVGVEDLAFDLATDTNPDLLEGLGQLDYDLVMVDCPGQRTGARMPKGLGPQALATWFAALPVTVQAALIAGQPDAVAAAEGLPAWALQYQLPDQPHGLPGRWRFQNRLFSCRSV